MRNQNVLRILALVLTMVMMLSAASCNLFVTPEETTPEVTEPTTPEATEPTTPENPVTEVKDGSIIFENVNFKYL